MNGDAAQDDRAALSFGMGIIGRVSRTFAIGIRLLPGTLRRAVLAGYLLCRIADTLEDDGALPAARRQELLRRFVACFDDPALAATFAAEAADVHGDEAYLELLAGTDQVFRLWRSLPAPSAAIVARWTRELASGMAEFVGRFPAGIRIQTMEQYRRYCYFVAGTVGHLLTDLWHAHSPLVKTQTYRLLLVHCEAFGEALQTVNILKDIAWDIEHENAAFIPEELLRDRGSSHQTILGSDRLAENHLAIMDLVAVAKEDLRLSLDYITTIPRGAFFIRLFCLLPILLAVATLREIERSTAMLVPGGGIKISRHEVRSLVLAGSLTTFSNRATRWLVAKAGRSPFSLGFAPLPS
jgi:farnesyl-diphosphate farnesyltransferase